MSAFDQFSILPHHILFESDKLLAGGLATDNVDIYGTSTYLDILEKDNEKEELDELNREIHEISDKIRTAITDILNEDDSYEGMNNKRYFNNTMFDFNDICKKSKGHLYILLPPTVSATTFNLIYPYYKEIMNLIETSNLYDTIVEDDSKDNVGSFFASVMKQSASKTTYVYTDQCREIIKKIKELIRANMGNDDYIINSYKYMPFKWKMREDERIEILMNIEKENALDPIFKKIRRNILSKYKITYEFDHIITNGLKYKIIPKDFLFYRAFPNDKLPFPAKNYMYSGFSFLEISGYTAPKEDAIVKSYKKFDTNSTCDLIGSVATFRVKKELKLLDLSDAQTVLNLRQIMEQNNDNVVLEHFKIGWNIKDGIVRRDSKYTYDYSVSDWLYKNNLDGFIGYGIPAFHNEVSLSKLNGEFPLDVIEIFPMKYSIPACREPFNQLNFPLTRG